MFLVALPAAFSPAAFSQSSELNVHSCQATAWPPAGPLLCPTGTILVTPVVSTLGCSWGRLSLQLLVSAGVDVSPSQPIGNYLLP